MHSKVRHLLDDGDGQLVPHVRAQAGEQLLHNLAGQGADHHLHDFTGHHRMDDPDPGHLITRAEEIHILLIQLDSDREEETPVGRVLMGEI